MSPRDDTSEATEEVVKGREDRCEVGENKSPLPFAPPYPG